MCVFTITSSLDYLLATVGHWALKASLPGVKSQQAIVKPIVPMTTSQTMSERTSIFKSRENRTLYRQQSTLKSYYKVNSFHDITKMFSPLRGQESRQIRLNHSTAATHFSLGLCTGNCQNKHQRNVS